MARGIAPVVGSDENRISLLYVADLAEAVVRLLDQGLPFRRAYELHDGHPGGYSWQEVIDAVQRLTGSSITRVKIPDAALKLAASLNLGVSRVMRRAPMLTPGKVRELSHPDWVGDNRALTSDTDWMPKITLPEGLRRTLRLHGVISTRRSF